MDSLSSAILALLLLQGVDCAAIRTWPIVHRLNDTERSIDNYIVANVKMIESAMTELKKIAIEEKKEFNEEIVQIWKTIEQQQDRFNRTDIDLGALTMKLSELQENFKDMENKTTDLANKLVQNGSGPVAFFATHCSQLFKNRDLSDATTIYYEKTVTNIGGGFDSETGIFTVPKKGIYIFNFHAMKTTVDAAVYLIRNGITMTSAFTGARGSMNIALSAALHLMQGDQVSVQLAYGSLNGNFIGPEKSFTSYHVQVPCTIGFSGYYVSDF